MKRDTNFTNYHEGTPHSCKSVPFVSQFAISAQLPLPTCAGLEFNRKERKARKEQRVGTRPRIPPHLCVPCVLCGYIHSCQSVQFVSHLRAPRPRSSAIFNFQSPNRPPRLCGENALTPSLAPDSLFKVQGSTFKVQGSKFNLQRSRFRHFPFCLGSCLTTSPLHNHAPHQRKNSSEIQDSRWHRRHPLRPRSRSQSQRCSQKTTRL